MSDKKRLIEFMDHDDLAIHVARRSISFFAFVFSQELVRGDLDLH
jgi:hypothetical protein